MKKQPVPQPTGVSAYFFRHLVHSADAQSLQLCSPDGEGQTGHVAANESRRMWQLVAAVLEKLYTPTEAKTLLLRCAEEERGVSVAIENILDASWKRVEKIIERNKQRRCVLEDELFHTLEKIDGYVFWTPESVVKRYEFPLPEGLWSYACEEDKPSQDVMALGDQQTKVITEGRLSDTNVAGDLREELAVVVLPPFSSSDVLQPTSHLTTFATASAAALAVPGKHNAMAWKKTDKDLLDPSKNRNCLRRLFAPILQKRHELPKSLTLFLNALQTIQSEKFPPIEELVQKGYFDIPFHRSFRYISSFITRYLVEEPRGAKAESVFVESYRPADAKLKEARENLWQVGSKNSPLSSARNGTAEIIYGTLLAELRGRKDLDRECESTLNAITAAIDSQLGEMEKALQECDEESCRALEELEKNATKYVENMTETVSYIKSVKEEVKTEYQRDHDRLFTSLQTKLYQAKKSEEHQEKLARRIREITKELYTEQLRYEKLLQEVVAESVGLRQLEVNYKQLEDVLEEHIPSEEVESRLKWVTDSLKQSKELREQLTAQCQQHISRLKTSEHYRKCRVACFASENAMCWSRCLNDLALLYESHHDTVIEKCDTSLQMRYLLAHEKELVLEDLSQLRREMDYLDSRWGALTNVLEELDLPVPSLLKYEQDDTCKKFRCMICQLAATRLIQTGFARLNNAEQGSQYFPQSNDLQNNVSVADAE